jgi:predicted phage terminase large subunit-like protein
LSSKELLLRNRYRKSLYEFGKACFRHVHGGDFIDCWHYRPLARHLQATVDREDPIRHIKRLLINLPPSTSKSYFMSQILTPWAWTRWPWMRFLYFSYNETRATKDSTLARDLVQSEWYQHYFGDIIQIAQGENQKQFYRTAQKGWRMTSHPGGTATGEHPHVIVIDDIISADQAVRSPAKRKEVADWYFETLSTRGIAQGIESTHVVGMQCLDPDDLSGHIIEYDAKLKSAGEPSPWVRVFFPMRFDPEYKMEDIGLGGDERTERGELLCPQLISPETVATVERDLSARYGDFAVEAQLQQRAKRRDGTLFKCGKIKLIKMADLPKKYDEIHRFWDLAGTEDAGCETAGSLVGRVGDDWYLVDMVAVQFGGDDVEDLMASTAALDQSLWSESNLRTSFEREGNSGGKRDAEIKELKLAAFNVMAVLPQGDKVTRAGALATIMKHGHFHMPEDAPWFQKTFAMFQKFPSGLKDRVDATVGAVKEILLPTHRVKQLVVAAQKADVSKSEFGQCKCCGKRPAFMKAQGYCCWECVDTDGERHSPECNGANHQWRNQNS